MTPAAGRGATERRRQVAIVGGGPVGLALAVDLGLRGISCVLVERRRGDHDVPKGQNLTQRTLEHFHFWGISDRLRAARATPADFPADFVVAYGDLAGGHWYVPEARAALDRYFHQRGERLPQYLTERVLRDRLGDCPGVEAAFGWEAVRIDADADGVRVGIRECGGPGRRTLRAEYVVGCDGARSTVRAQAGIAQSGRDYAQPMVLAVFRSTALHDGLARLPPACVYRVVHKDLKGYWRFFGRVDERERWFFHAPVRNPAEAAEGNVRRLLHRTAGFAFPCSFDHIGVWDMRWAVAGSYRRGRVFVAGDAAHAHPPYGGFGLNTGFEDAANLGWKLAAVLDGWGGEALLRSYDGERRAVALETVRDFISGRMEADREFFDRCDPEGDPDGFARAWRSHRRAGAARMKAYEPNYEGSPVVAGPPGAVCGARGAHRRAARPGHHLAPAGLSDGRNVFDALGRGFTLLALDAPARAVAAFESAARERGVPLEVVRDRLAGDRRAYGARLVLVRPDQHVAWAGDAAPLSASVLMSKVAGLPEAAGGVSGARRAGASASRTG